MISKFRQEKKGGKNTRALARHGGHVTRGERGKFSRDRVYFSMRLVSRLNQRQLAVCALMF